MEPPGLSDSSLTWIVLPSPRPRPPASPAGCSPPCPGLRRPPIRQRCRDRVPPCHGVSSSPSRSACGRTQSRRAHASTQFRRRRPFHARPAPTAGRRAGSAGRARRRRRSPFPAAARGARLEQQVRRRQRLDREELLAASTERSSCCRASGASVEWSSTSADSVGAPSVAGAARNLSSASSPAAEYQSSPGSSSRPGPLRRGAAARCRCADAALRRIQLGDPTFAGYSHVRQAQPQAPRRPEPAASAGSSRRTPSAPTRRRPTDCRPGRSVPLPGHLRAR